MGVLAKVFGFNTSEPQQTTIDPTATQINNTDEDVKTNTKEDEKRRRGIASTNTSTDRGVVSTLLGQQSSQGGNTKLGGK